jgi:hypothetical protein
MANSIAEKWEITPLVGVGPLKFGMRQADVAKLEGTLGEIYRAFEETGPNGQKVVKEARDLGAPVCVFYDDLLSEINLDWRSDFPVFFDGLDIFRSRAKDVLQTMERKSGTALFGLGLVLFDSLSINTSGYFIKSKSGPGGSYWDDVGDKSIDRTVSVAKKDSFRTFLGEYEPISFL